jgi:hypothetical protein
MQFGSREGKQCPSAILHKILGYDIVRHTKEMAAYIENNAVGCFDCMVNNLLILCLCRLGVLTSATQSLAKAWSSLIHCIRTQFGISSNHHSNTPEHPLFGPGQGSTIGPFLWIHCYCMIVDSMKLSTPKFTITSCDKSNSITTAGSSFVDDTGLGVTAPHISLPPTEGIEAQPIQQAVTMLHTLARHWEKLLFTNGRAINFPKSAWFVLGWKWSNGKAILV